MFLMHLPECMHSSTFHSMVFSPLVKYLIFFNVIPVISIVQKYTFREGLV